MMFDSHARTSSASASQQTESLAQTSYEVELGLSIATESMTSGVPEDTTKLTPGSVIPDTRLEIVRWLGEGGMGSVFEVRHLDIDRHFAAKLLHRSESVARARRFRREAKTIGTIGSPWIVEVFDFKELPDGRLMYLMELVDGPTLLARQAQRGGIELARLIGLARQICKGLCDAHERGFIHRDIKPENIMIATDPDGRERVKIVDFGLAGLLARPNESSRGGTPMYMSPEQCQGVPADRRADIYSLGVTLYELGSGSLPFIYDNAEALREAHTHEQPTPPSKLEGAPPLPASFDALVLRCMAKHPDDRFADAAEVEAALIELQVELKLRTEWDDLPVPELPEPRRHALERGLAALRRDRERERRRRTAFGGVLAAMVVISSAIGWYAGAQTREAAVAQAELDLGELEREIQAAAAARRWVYPSAEQPDAATAYALLLQLESLDLARADEVGRELRDAIAGQLLVYADAYWDAPGGRSFAREFYAHALVFDPEQPRALERAGLSPSAAAALRERAATGDFDDAERETIKTLTALAVPDPTARLEALLDLYADVDELPTSVAIGLDRLIEDLEQQVPEDAGARRRPARPALRVEPEPVLEQPETPPEGEAEIPTEDEAETETEPEPDATKARPKSTAGDRSGAAKLLAEADAAFLAGRRDEAASKYQRVLELDASNLGALVGLHRIHFDRGEFKDALAYARRAATLRPKRADLQLDVGDSCMKVLDYTCARTHYEKAKALGAKQAAQRLQMLDERLGKSKGPAAP